MPNKVSGSCLCPPGSPSNPHYWPSPNSFHNFKPSCHRNFAIMVGGSVISANPLRQDVRSHRKCLFMCALVTVSTFQYGLDYALVGGFMAMPGFLRVFGYYDEAKRTWAIDPTVQQLISSLMTIGTFVGSLLVGPFSSKFGRRYGLWTASVLNFISTAIMLGTTSLGALYFARLILGKSF